MRKVLFLFLFIFSFLFLTLKPVSAGAWIENEIISEFAAGPEISIASDGFARVVLLKSDLSLDYLKCTNMSCTAYTRTDLSFTNHSNLDTYAIVEGSDNYSKIVATSSTTGIWLINCLNADCSSRTSTLLDGTATNPREVDIKKAPDGFLRIFYKIITPGSIRLIQCTNIDCSSNNNTLVTLANLEKAGFDLDSNGLAHIVYGDYDTLGYVYLQCTNDSCSTFTTSSIHEGEFEEPADLRMVLGTDNLARIVYANALTGSLSIIVCDNSTCSTNTETILVASYSTHFTIARDSNNFIHTTVIVTDSEGDIGERRAISCTNSLCTAYDSTVIYSNTMANSDTIAFDASNNGYIPFGTDLGYLHFATKTADPTPTPTPTSVPTATPIPAAGPAVPRPDGERSTTDTPTCNERDLNETPDLFQITTSKTTATLYFSPISDIRKYYVSYGTTESAEQYGADFEYGDPSGVLSYSVNMLSPNQTYYFKVRGGRGCKAGAWGNVMKAKTTSGNAKQVFYKNIFSQIFTSLTNSTAQAKTNMVLGASTKPKSCSYVVESGDSLWSIAQSTYSNGDLYTKLMKLNNLKDTTIHPGQKLKAC